MMYLVEIGEIKDMLSARYEIIRDKIWHETQPPEYNQKFQATIDEAWASYLNGIDCIALADTDIRDDFADIINYSAQGRVCIDMEDEDTPYILMPMELAQKVVVLGSLPDTWCPEKSAS